MVLKINKVNLSNANRMRFLVSDESIFLCHKNEQKPGYNMINLVITEVCSMPYINYALTCAWVAEKVVRMSKKQISVAVPMTLCQYCISQQRD